MRGRSVLTVLVAAVLVAAVPGGCSGGSDRGFAPVGDTDGGADAGAGADAGVDAGAEGGATCRANTDCDDRVACTRDLCLVDGTCQHSTQDTQCPVGQTCNATLGCVTPGMGGACRTAADCDDHFACTDDVCGVDGHCSHVPQNGRCATGQVCAVGMGCVAAHACSSDHDCDDGLRCNGMERCTELACVAGTPIDCNSHDPCMMDMCVETGPMACIHTANPMCTVSVRSGIYNVAMPVSYVCHDSILGMAAVTLDIRFLQFAVSSSGLTVTAGPTGPTMMGPAPSGGTFMVMGSVAGGCMENYQLSGMFTDATHFTGRFAYSFTGLDCGFTDCMAGSVMVSGVVRM